LSQFLRGPSGCHLSVPESPAGATCFSPLGGALAEAQAEGGSLRGTRPGGVIAFFDVPERHWKKVRTTNVIERAFREVRRRTRPMSSFTNPASCERIVFGVISHLNSSWERKPLKEFTQNA